jgi:hypothetical protein
LEWSEDNMTCNFGLEPDPEPEPTIQTETPGVEIPQGYPTSSGYSGNQKLFEIAWDEEQASYVKTTFATATTPGSQERVKSVYN